MTNGSLLAMATFFPAQTASRVGSNPTAPTRALMTTSTSSIAAISLSPPTPDSTVISNGRLFRTRFSSSPSATQTKRGRQARARSRSLSTRRPALRATTRYRSRPRLSMTSKVESPMEPVHPRMDTEMGSGFMRGPSGAPHGRRLSLERLRGSFAVGGGGGRCCCAGRSSADGVRCNGPPVSPGPPSPSPLRRR